MDLIIVCFIFALLITALWITGILLCFKYMEKGGVKSVEENNRRKRN